MTKYITQEREKYWPVSPELMAQYKDGSHTKKNRFCNLLWFQNNQYHRDSDKPAIIYSDGSLQWWKNGKRHRDDDKPAIIRSNGELGWYQNGELHRLCGPAEITADGRLAWWINGKNITEEVTEWLNGEECCGTPEQIVEFKFRFT